MWLPSNTHVLRASWLLILSFLIISLSTQQSLVESKCDHYRFTETRKPSTCKLDDIVKLKQTTKFETWHDSKNAFAKAEDKSRCPTDVAEYISQRKAEMEAVLCSAWYDEKGNNICPNCVVNNCGSAACDSDIDLTSEGAGTDVLVRNFNQIFEQRWGVPSAIKFDLNLYGMSWKYPNKVFNKVCIKEYDSGKEEKISLLRPLPTDKAAIYKQHCFAMMKLHYYLMDFDARQGFPKPSSSSSHEAPYPSPLSRSSHSGGSLLRRNIVKKSHTTGDYTSICQMSPAIETKGCKRLNDYAKYFQKIHNRAWKVWWNEGSQMLQEVLRCPANVENCPAGQIADMQDITIRNRVFELYLAEAMKLLQDKHIDMCSKLIETVSKAKVFAMEAYYTSGTFLQVVVVDQQGHKVDLTEHELFDSLMENAADSLKELNHAIHKGMQLDEYVNKMAKYLSRMMNAASVVFKIKIPTLDVSVKSTTNPTTTPPATKANAATQATTEDKLRVEESPATSATTKAPPATTAIAEASPATTSKAETVTDVEVEKIPLRIIHDATINGTATLGPRQLIRLFADAPHKLRELRAASAEQRQPYIERMFGAFDELGITSVDKKHTSSRTLSETTIRDTVFDLWRIMIRSFAWTFFQQNEEFFQP